MRLVTYATPVAPPQPGIELPDGSVIRVARVLGEQAPATVARLLGAMPQVRERLDEAVAAVVADPGRATSDGLRVAADAVRLLAPLGERVLVVCTGANYRSHLQEMGEEPPEKPAWFIKNPNSVIGPGEPIRLPAGHADQVDFEGELCVVFGRLCHDVAAADANSYLAGYTVLNDVSARDALPGVAAAETPEQGRWAWTEMLLGKQFPSFAPLGPAVVTADEIDDPADLRLTTTVNGAVMQEATTGDLAVDVPTLVAQLSRYFAFQPGDVLSTGTPAGVGVARTPPVFLRPGDTVTVEVKGVGALINPVIRDSRP